MNAPLALAELANMRAAAAVNGETVAARALRRAWLAVAENAKRQGMQTPQEAAWRRLSINLRAYLIAESTERAEPHRDAERGWADFTADEQVAIGAQAREWRRQLGGCGALR